MLLLNRNILKQIEGKKMRIFGEILQAINDLVFEGTNQAVTCQEKNHAAGNRCWIDSFTYFNGTSVYYQHHELNNLVLISLGIADQKVTELERSESLWVSGNSELAELVAHDGPLLKEIVDSLTTKIGCTKILLFQGGEQIEI